MNSAVLAPLQETGVAPRKKFTSDEVRRMLDSGIFAGQRFELIDGDLIEKMGQNPPHASAIHLALEWLADLFGVARIRVQSPIDAAIVDSERSFPEPDIAVLRERKPDFLHRHPRGSELLLVIEVSDTTLYTDASTKRDIYARAAVPEYWVVDLNNRRIIVHRAPAAGVYTEITALAENETIAPESESSQSIPVARLLP